MAKVRTYSQQQKTVKKKKKKKQKIEFSKKIFYMLSTMILAIVIYSMALMWHVGDTTPLAYLTPAAFGAYSVGIGFYYDKAKKENLNKFNIANIEATKVDEVTYEDDSALQQTEGTDISG